MALFRVVPGPGLAQLQRRVQGARMLLSDEIPATLQQLGQECATALGAAAPRGQAEGASPPGDAPGPLAESFVASVEGGAGVGSVVVRTTQPTKLSYVRNGTGIYGPNGEPIRPKSKKALYWPGADHPVRQVKGQKPNDFVSPIVEEYVNVGDDRMDELAIRVADMLNGEGAAL